ncbi:MAG: hypothetical protein JST54_07050 [Deltaproteobacteria bacterium]|nr:hypothetical protein [Deltaproteobacteria bacterium]
MTRVLAFSLLLVLAGCSKDKEQCQAMALAAADLDNGLSELRSAAEVGNQAGFDAAKGQLTAGMGKLATLEVSGSSPSAETLRGAKKELAEELPQAIDGYQKLLAAVEKKPNLGQAYSGGRPPLSAAGVSLDVSGLRATLATTRTITCR